jgi:hypothetical protein
MKKIKRVLVQGVEDPSSMLIRRLKLLILIVSAIVVL